MTACLARKQPRQLSRCEARPDVSRAGTRQRCPQAPTLALSQADDPGLGQASGLRSIREENSPSPALPGQGRGRHREQSREDRKKPHNQLAWGPSRSPNRCLPGRTPQPAVPSELWLEELAWPRGNKAPQISQTYGFPFSMPPSPLSSWAQLCHSDPCSASGGRGQIPGQCLGNPKASCHTGQDAAAHSACIPESWPHAT